MKTAVGFGSYEFEKLQLSGRFTKLLRTNNAVYRTCIKSNPVETGFYYLNSRYYDPAVGRFINADGYASTGQGVLGTNTFAYCLNNPVNYSDPSGYSCSEYDWDLHFELLYANEAASPITSTVPSDSGGGGARIPGPLGAVYYENIEDCVNDWLNGVIPLTAKDYCERGAIIKKKTIKGQVYYYMDKTYIHQYRSVWITAGN